MKASSFPLICCQLISHESHMTDHKEQDQDWTSSRCSDLDIGNDQTSSDVDWTSSDVDQVSIGVDQVPSDADCVHVLDGGSGQEGRWRKKEPELLTGTEISALGRRRGGKLDKEMKGSIVSFVLNNQVQKILPGISIAANSGSIATSGGTCPPVSILYRTSVDRSVLHNVGMVTRRLPPSGKPIEWAKWTNPHE